MPLNSHLDPVAVSLATQETGVLKSWQMMRESVLNIIPHAATREKTLSGKTGKRWHMIMDPPLIQQMLLERLEDYPKSTVTKNLLRPAIGESLFIAEGAHWRWQRRASAPVFSHRNVNALGPVMTAAAERCATRVEEAGGKRAVNMLDEMIATTFDVIAEVTFSDDGSFDRDAVHSAIEDYVSDAGRISLLDVLGAPDWVPRPEAGILDTFFAWTGRRSAAELRFLAAVCFAIAALLIAAGIRWRRPVLRAGVRLPVYDAFFASCGGDASNASTPPSRVSSAGSRCRRWRRRRPASTSGGSCRASMRSRLTS